MYTITVIGDTHMPRMAKQFPPFLVSVLEKTDMIIHVGDIQTLEVLNSIELFAPTVGVHGNVDDNEIIKRLPKSIVLQLGNVNIGITHGDGKSKTTEKRAVEQFEFDDVDIIIYGHSHIPILKQYEDVLLFNPGSPTDKRKQKEFSFGIIEISDIISLKHIFFADKSTAF